MTFIRSQARRSDIAEYTEGSCHNLATVIHWHTGWPLLLVYERADPSITNRWGDTLHSLMHVACIDPDGNAWDVTGRIHRTDAARHYRRYMGFTKVGFDVMEDAADLQRYIGFGKYQVLADQYPTSLEWAERDARRILREFNLLPPPAEFTETAPAVGMESFEEDYASGVASVNHAIGISLHFGYPVAAAFGPDRKLIRAWSEDFNGRPITASGLLLDHSELDLPADCTMKIWEVPHHIMADGRLRRVLGSEALDTSSVLEAFALAQKAFPSIRDRFIDGRWVTAYTLRGSVDEMLTEAKYDEEFGGLKELARHGRPHGPMMEAGAVLRR